MMDVKFLAKNKVRKELIMPTVSQVTTTTTSMMMYEQTKFSHGRLRGGSRKGTDRGER